MKTKAITRLCVPKSFTTSAAPTHRRRDVDRSEKITQLSSEMTTCDLLPLCFTEGFRMLRHYTEPEHTGQSHRTTASVTPVQMLLCQLQWIVMFPSCNVHWLNHKWLKVAHVSAEMHFVLNVICWVLFSQLSCFLMCTVSVINGALQRHLNQQLGNINRLEECLG